MSCSFRIGTGSNTENDVIYNDPTQEVSEKMNVGKWPRDHSLDILTKGVAAFCPCSEHIPEAKEFGLFVLTGEISGQPGYICVLLGYYCSLQCRCIMKRNKLGKDKYKIYSSMKRGSAENLSFEPSPVLKRESIYGKTSCKVE